MSVKILIADDEPDILEIMAKRVTQEGYDVVTACDGQEAWDKIGCYNPDVILLDLAMPRMDGFTVLEKLRATPPSGKWQPVIIVSANDEYESFKKGLAMEADHYLTKPCNPENVVKTIKLMISLIPQRKASSESERNRTE